MELEDIFGNDIDVDNYCSNHNDFIINQTLQIQSVCDCLLTLSIIKMNYSLVYFIKSIKRNISNNRYLNEYNIKYDLQKIQEYKLTLQNIDFNILIAEIEEYLEMCSLLNMF